MLPPGLAYLDSWIDTPTRPLLPADGDGRCELVDEWTANWNDVVTFEIIPVISSAEANARVA
jgi:hypothetical protein